MANEDRVIHRVGGDAWAVSSMTDSLTGERVLRVRQSDRIVIPSSWSRVERIGERRGKAVEKIDDLFHLVEVPLLPACIKLYQAGFVTTESNANVPEGARTAWLGLTINLETSKMTPQQLRAAESLAEKDPKWSITERDPTADELTPDNYRALRFNWEIDPRKTSPIDFSRVVEAGVTKLVGGKKTLVRVRPDMDG